jgi:hypothetical protein
MKILTTNQLFLSLHFFVAFYGSSTHANPVSVDMELPYKYISFIVKDAKTGKPISEGREDLKQENGYMTKTTKYWLFGDHNKSVIQEETCSFELKSLRPRYYKFQNAKTGEFVSLSGLNESAFAENLRYKDAADKPEVSGTFAWKSGMIFGKTLHHLIVRSWSKLVKNEHESFPLYVPMKRDQYVFRVSKKSDKTTADVVTRVISLEPDNWAFRQLAPSMLFFYAEKNGVPTVVRYEGPTTVTVDKDSDRKVVIEFAYDSDISGAAL